VLLKLHQAEVVDFEESLHLGAVSTQEACEVGDQLAILQNVFVMLFVMNINEHTICYGNLVCIYKKSIFLNYFCKIYMMYMY
jgi:hypothetical protein